ncbi:unnamed protein product [Cyclocybe aegerita]|uniref:Peptidase C14 caspase domain-containing protein n=1 Tax=Cyclocybe aegerita TaxID=1973307 RepID=A0A8S0VXS3_CYCAE|nr:unnamed protein product [Cyclocybe aegerita]
MRKFVGHFRPLLSHLLLALSYHLRLCISLSFRLAHILPSRFRRRPRKAKRRALMIGISVVTDQPSAEELADSSLSPASTPEGGLKGPHGEARAMGALLEVQYGYSPDDIVYLLDLPGYEYPTRDNILKYMKLLVQDADKDDHFFIHYDEYVLTSLDILTCWNEKILDDELKAHLVTPLPDGCTLTAIFDSCHSGTLLDLPHYLCNRVHLPFVNKGTRRTNPLWRIQARRRAILPGTREAVCEQPTRIEAVPSSSPTRRVSNSVERGNAAGPVAKTALSVVTKPSNEAPLLCEDICLSPIQNHQYCDGFQCVESPKGGPNVICISSSGDAQETWEDENGTSVTAELIAIFSVNPHPVLTEVMSTISRDLSSGNNGKRKALIIGIIGPTFAEQIGALKGPHEDAKRVGCFLQKHYGYDPNNIKYLLDDPDFEQPTKDNIIKYIGLLVNDAQPGDHFFFHYSGHSAQQDTDDPQEEDGKNECIVTSDDNYILDNELNDMLVKPLPVGGNLTVLLDACHSGTLLDLPHYRCNGVYLPCVNRGQRRANDRWMRQVRRGAMYPNNSTRAMISQQRRRSSNQQLERNSTALCDTGPTSTSSSFRTSSTLSLKPYARRQGSLHFCENERRCASPDPVFRHCDGFTCTTWQEIEEPVANVICFSSSADHQRTWEDKDGNSMTDVFLNMLSINPYPCLTELLAAIRLGCQNSALRLHPEAVEYHKVLRLRNKRRIARHKMPFEDRIQPEMNDFQIPQLSSLIPLPLDQKWDP